METRATNAAVPSIQCLRSNCINRYRKRTTPSVSEIFGRHYRRDNQNPCFRALIQDFQFFIPTFFNSIGRATRPLVRNGDSRLLPKIEHGGAEIALAGIGQNHHDVLAGVLGTLRELCGSGYGSTGRDANEQTVMRGKLTTCLEGLFVRDGDDLIVDVCIERLGYEAGADALDAVRSASALGKHGESAGSTATTRTLGFCSFKYAPAPLIVPPVPTPATRMSTSPSVPRQISGPVVR